MEKGLVSIIIRTKNEEKWIVSCLNSVFEQDYKKIEVIIVDNGSTDKTVDKTRPFDVILCKSNDVYRPGKLLNLGIRQSKGEFIVCLSGHCIAVNNRWLTNLIQYFKDSQIAGVYGKQEPLSFTPDVDKRDLITTFRNERIIQTKDSFFHNANSMIRRSVWEEIPFNEEVTNIEDRLWGKSVIEKGLKLVYEPEASVYHSHGIHQSNDIKRCSNIVKILEEIDLVKQKDIFNANDLKVHALVPIKGESKQPYIYDLIHYTINDLKTSSYINDVYVITDDEDIARYAEEKCAITPIIRPKEFSTDYINLTDIFQYVINKLEEKNIISDLVVLANITYPFRPKHFFDTLIDEIITSGMDTVVAAHPEFRISWKFNGTELIQLNDFRPRKFKDPVQVGMFGLGCATHPFKIRENEIFSGKIGIYEVKNQISSIEVRTESDYEVLSHLIKEWVKNKSDDKRKDG